jgi:small nuclear ribonucleoprotein
MIRLGGKSTAEAIAKTDFKGEKEGHGLPPSNSESKREIPAAFGEPRHGRGWSQSCWDGHCLQLPLEGLLHSIRLQESNCRIINAPAISKALNAGGDTSATQGEKPMVMPLNVLEKSINKRISLLLKDNRILEGKLMGYDDYMNMVLEDAEETKDELVRRIGTVVLRGNNVVTIVPK